METFVNFILIPIALLTVLVFAHELGHFSIARRNKVRVEVFSIGFGAELFGFNDKHGTRWKFCAIPLGGYVKMFGEGEEIAVEGGEEDESRPLTPEEKAVSFHHKRLSQRAAIVVAGPVANFIFAILVLGVMFAIAGKPAPLAGVGTIQSGSAAESAGFESGDRVIKIGDQDIRWFEDLRQIVSASPGMELTFGIQRQESILQIRATPKPYMALDAAGVEKEIGLLGITPDPTMIEYIDVGPLDAVWMGVERTYGLTTQILSALGQMISGSRSADELGGPIRIAQMIGDISFNNPIGLVFILAALSVNLGLINLFPIPMLDGGHLLFYAIEAIIGRPVKAIVQEYSFRFGLGLVLLLMVFATWNDVKITVIESIRNFIT